MTRDGRRRPVVDRLGVIARRPSHWLPYVNSVGGFTAVSAAVTVDPSFSVNGFCEYLHCALASGAVYCNRSCLCVCNGRAGGVRTLLQPARAQRLRLSERFFHLYCFVIGTT